MGPLRSLGAFMEAAEGGSFTEAGRRLGLSPSAVSKAVLRLEDRLGTRLFHRSTRSVTLTAEGRLFLERCRRIAAELEAAERDLVHMHEAPRGKLKISLPSAGMPFMPKLTEFQKLYPDIQLDMDCSDRLVDVIDEGFDVVLRTGAATDSRLVARVIGSYRQVVVGSPAYLAVRGVPERPEDLRDHACILYRSPTTGKLLDWPVSPGGGMADGHIAPASIANALEPQLAFARHGAGLACLPDFAVADDLASGAMCTVLDAAMRGEVTFRLLWPSSRHLAPKTRAFVDFATAELLLPKTR